MVCDRWYANGTAAFVPVTNEPLLPVVVQVEDREAAATFVVHRSDLDQPAMALWCKDHGRYLAPDAPTGELRCSQLKPWTLLGTRVTWWDFESANFKSPESHQYIEAGDPGINAKVRADNADGSGWALWKVFLVGGYEHIRPLIRGVNLGNWFLSEKWMSPELYWNASDGAPFRDPCVAMDEYGLMEVLGQEASHERMERHWATWITEEDISWLANHGINAVRVPFGYWMVFPSPPFVFGQLKYLRRLFWWCEKHSIAVLLDFHGLKGSQTGNPTSGNCGGCGRRECGPTHINFLEEQRTNLLVIEKLTLEFAHSPAFLGMAVANEVASTADSKETMAFYQKAYDIIRRKSQHALVVIFATFNPSTFPFPNFQNIALDVHIYFGMGFGNVSCDQQRNLGRARKAVADPHWPVLVGEWSLGGSGHPALNESNGTSEDYYTHFARMQLQAWEAHTIGWFYWSYKTTSANSLWNFRDMCRLGLLPGCSEGAGYATTEWWRAPNCAYAYLNGSCSAQEAPREGWALPLVLTLGSFVAAGVLVAAIASLKLASAGPGLATAGGSAQPARKAVSNLMAGTAELTNAASSAAFAKMGTWRPQLLGWRRLLGREDLHSSGRPSPSHSSRSSQILIRLEPAEQQPFVR